MQGNEIAVSTGRGAMAPATSTRFFDLEPQARVAQASAIASVLKDIIVQQELWVKLGAGEHVLVEGWQTLGSLLGIQAQEDRVIGHEDGTYEAYVNLVNVYTGVVLGGASAICGTDERPWDKASRNARRSMAITRATGKAYRSNFGWIMKLAGYNPTPAEEMPGYVPGQRGSQVPPAPAVQQPRDDDPAHHTIDAYDGEPYDDGDMSQRNWLLKGLKQRGVPMAYQEEIRKAFHGKKEHELDAVIAKVRQGD